ncbi:hypothetical protein ACKWTF_014041 [Chironomus riparius]
MKGNTCSSESLIKREDIDKKLQLCYDYFVMSNSNLELITTRSTTPRRRTFVTATTTTKSKFRVPQTTTTPRTTTSTTQRVTSLGSTTQQNTQMPFRSWKSKTRTPKKVKVNECGTRPGATALIVNGENFEKGTYPWMAVLVKNNNDVHCGGVLISNRKVLTAGHCIHTKSFTEYNKKDLQVILGSHDLISRFEVSREIKKIDTIFPHPRWNPMVEKFDYDIAVIVLEEEVHFNNYIQPICLPNNNKIVKSITMGTVIGYGKTEDRSKQFSNIPKRAQAPIYNYESCVRKFSDLQSIASKTTFCGGHANGTGACTGDSGSGLFVSHNNIFYLRGLVSSSQNNNEIGCDVKKYAVYTNVTKFIEWINKIPVSQLSSRLLDEDEDEDEEDERNKLWDTSLTRSPDSDDDNDTGIVYFNDSEMDSDNDVGSGSDNEVTTYETGRVWNS